MQIEPSSRQGRNSLLIAGITYGAIGLVTSLLAGNAASPQLMTFWRFAGWVLSFATFIIHVIYENAKPGNAIRRVAMRAAVAVAIGALLLAIGGPVRSHWNAGDLGRVSILSVIAWPLLTGIPAFFAALLAAALLGRVRRSPDRTASRSNAPMP